MELVGPVSSAADINDKGVVAGWHALDALSPRHAFRRSARGAVTDLGPGEAHAVNNAGVVVGERHDSEGNRHATRWDVDGQAHDLGVGPGSWAIDVNDHGVVVGYTPSELGFRAFAAAPGRAAVLLPHPAGIPEHQDLATAINDRGDIAGVVVAGDTRRVSPVVWRGRHHTPTLLPAPNEYHSVTGINEHGTVLGIAIDTNGFRTVIWTGRNHREIAITASGEGAVGRAINDKGQVAGVLIETSDVFRWDPRTGLKTILQGLFPFNDAFGMNNEGCVVGTSSFFDQSNRATLFAPC